MKGAGHRRYCFTCRPSKPAEESPVLPIRPAAQVDPPLVAATRTELGVRAGTADGLVCLAVAEQIAAGGHSASGLAALQRAFREAKSAALAGNGDSAGAQVLKGLFGTP